MELSCTGEDRELCISLTGEVDHHRARGLMEGIDREVGIRLPRHLVLDLGGGFACPGIWSWTWEA